MTANVSSAPLNKGDFTKTTLPIGWLLFTLLAVETYNLHSKLPTKIHQLHYPASRTSFSGTIMSCRRIGVREGILQKGRKKFALKITICL